jgi:hypothetical protein
VITYAPLATDPTVKLPVLKVPDAVMVHDGVVATLAGVMVHAPESLVEKPLPVIVTTVPIIPEVGLRAIFGPCTVKVA